MNPKAGCAGSVLDMLHVPGFNHQAEVAEGVLEQECSYEPRDRKAAETEAARLKGQETRRRNYEK